MPESIFDEDRELDEYIDAELVPDGYADEAVPAPSGQHLSLYREPRSGALARSAQPSRPTKTRSRHYKPLTEKLRRKGVQAVIIVTAKEVKIYK